MRNLNYAVAGTDADGNVIGTDTEFRYTGRSLRVPIHLGVRLMDPLTDPALNIYLFGGPTALMAMDANLRNDALDVEHGPRNGSWASALALSWASCTLKAATMWP